MVLKQPSERVKRDVASCECKRESANVSYIDKDLCHCYTTAELTKEEVGDKLVFAVGDGEEYGGYYNGELEAQQKYSIYVAAKVDTEVKAFYIYS